MYYVYVFAWLYALRYSYNLLAIQAVCMYCEVGYCAIETVTRAYIQTVHVLCSFQIIACACTHLVSMGAHLFGSFGADIYDLLQSLPFNCHL